MADGLLRRLRLEWRSGSGELPIELPADTDGAAHFLAPGLPARAVSLRIADAPADGARVSCIMATRGELQPAVHAIGCFRRQTYPARELVIACASPDSAVAQHVAALGDPAIRFVVAPGAGTVGALRNAAIAQATGTLACVWDDDDIAHPRRIAWQVASLAAAGARGCFLSRVLLWWPARRRIALSPRRIWENTMLAERAVLPPYPDVVRGGDTILGKALRDAAPLVLIDRPQAYCYVAHGGNLWGAEHFEMLFANASAAAGDEADYDSTVAALAPALPLPAYAAGISGATSAG